MFIGAHLDVTSLSSAGISYIISFSEELEQPALELENSIELLATGKKLFLFKLQKPLFSQTVPENIFCIMKTSGTTGATKIVKIENYCIESNVNCLRSVISHTWKSTCSKNVSFLGRSFI